MEIDIQVEGKTIVALVRGRVDTVSAQAFEKELGGALNREETCLVLDLSGLEYISSAGLRVILSAAKTLKARGGEIRLAAMQGSVRKVFQISGFLSLFKSFETKAAAVEGA
ncbi:MAG: STAS domain-containing protein [Pseudomonadota bacterium]